MPTHTCTAAAQTGGTRIASFTAKRFHANFAASFAYVAICTAITITFAVVAYAVIRAHPAAAYSLLPAGLVPDESARVSTI